MFKYIYNIHNL